jgi:hypothetical protein
MPKKESTSRKTSNIDTAALSARTKKQIDSLPELLSIFSRRYMPML